MKIIFYVLIALTLVNSCANQDEKKEEDKNVKDTLKAESPVIIDTVENSLNMETKVPDYLVNDNPPFDYERNDMDHIYGYDFDGDTILYTEGKKVLTEGTVEGEFTELSTADYIHLTIKDKKGWYHNYWLWLDDADLMDFFWQGYEFKRGQKMRVHWKRERQFIPEANGEIVMYKMVKFDLLEN